MITGSSNGGYDIILLQLYQHFFHSSHQGLPELFLGGPTDEYLNFSLDLLEITMPFYYISVDSFNMDEQWPAFAQYLSIKVFK